MKKRPIRILFFVVTLGLCLTLSNTCAFAATKKKTVKYSEELDNSSANGIEKKATRISKTGTYKLTFKKGSGYLMFIAPKTKTYKLTFSNFAWKKKYPDGYATIRFTQPDKFEPGYWEELRIVKGGVGGCGSSGVYYNDFELAANKWKKNPMGYLLKRTIKTKLKKGSRIYIYIRTEPSGYGKSTGTFSVK